MINYLRTLVLNLLFIFLFTVLMSTYITSSMVVLAIYSLLEVYIDHYHKVLSMSKPLLIKGWAGNVLTNLIQIFAMSYIFERYMFDGGLYVVLSLTVAMIMLVSLAEVEIDKRLIKEGTGE